MALTPQERADIMGDFLEFSKYMFKAINGSEFVVNWHHQVIAEALEKVVIGQTTRLIINVPPRHSKCVKDTSMIMTKKGYVPASDVAIGDTVMSHINGRLVGQKIIGREEFDKDSVKVKTKTGRTIDLSFDHPVLTQDGWVEAGKLKESDYLIRVSSIIDGKSRMDDAELDFVTLMLFEGGCSDERGRNIRFTNMDDKVVSIFKDACKKLGIGVKQYSCNKSFEYNIMGGSIGNAAKILRKHGMLGHLAKNKRMPLDFFDLPLDQKYRFISLMTATDGYVVKNDGNLAVCLASEGLIDDISLMLDTVGITGVKYLKPNDCAGAFELKITPYQTKKIASKLDCLQKQEKLDRINNMNVRCGSTFGYPHEVSKGLTFKCRKATPKIDFKNGKGIVSYDKFERIANEIDPSIRDKWTKKDFMYDKVSQVDLLGVERVVHFEVDGDCYDNKNFICDGFVVHNTELAVVNFIAWTMGLYPDSEYLHVSYGATLAENNSYNTKMLVESEAYKEIFPNVSLKKDSNARNKWATNQGGVVHAMGISGTITGKGAGKMREGFAGAVIIDDPLKPSDAQSDTVRPHVNEWYSSVMESRLNKKSTPIILIMQRLHEDDLSGFLADGGSGEEWDHLVIPSINEDGEALWPFKHTIEDLRRMEAKSPYSFSGQHMQRPSPQGGGMFKEAWLNWYVSHNMPEFKTTFITADTAIKTKEQNDYSVIQHWGLTHDSKLYLLDMKRAKWESPELDKVFRAFYADCSRKYKVRTCYIEDKASGSQLIQGLKKYGGIPITPVPRSIDKITRAQDAAPWVSMGVIYLNKEIDQIDSLVSELSTFPVARHDDTVDCLMDAINIGMFKNQGIAVVDYGNEVVKANKYTSYG